MEKAQQDSAGLMRYYEDHKIEFLTKKGIETKIFSLRIPDGDKKLASAYRKYSRRKQTDNLMLEKFNKKNDSVLVINERIFFEGDDPVIDKIEWNIGKQNIKINNYPSIIIINKVIEPVPKPFSEIEGEMIAGYQDYLEREWIKQLRAKYTVKINDHIYELVKKSLIND